MQEILKEILKKNNLSGEPVKEIVSGQINHTYQVGNNHVVKVQNKLDVLLHQVPLIESCLKVGAKVPRITDSGIIGDKEYIVMEKIPGKTLAEDWYIFSDAQKENFIAQLAEQLRQFHSIKFEKYSTQRPLEFATWKEALTNYTDFSTASGKNFDAETQENLDLIADYFHSHEYLLEETNSAVLVYNDLHFENILYEEGEITGIIDFDFARQAPKDYELWHLIDFLFNPMIYVEKKLEEVWKQYSVGSEFKLLQKYYPELFADEHLLARVRMYLIENILGKAADGYTDQSNQRVRAYFKTNWLEEKLVI